MKLLKNIAKIVCIGAFFAVPNLAAVAQETNKVEEPEYQEVFFFLDKANTNLVTLERQTPVLKTKLKVLGYAGGQSLIEIKGEKSPKRFTEGQALEFIVRVPSQQRDPQSFIQYIKFETKNGNRQMVVLKAGTFGTNMRSTVQDGLISFDAVKYGESSFKVKASAELPLGEYAVGTADSKDAFCFGVDPKGSSTEAAKENTKGSKN